VTRPSTPRSSRSTPQAHDAAPRRVSRPTRAARAAIPSVRPLLVRAEARYTCFGDGLCCTDIHALGPVTPRERREVDLIEPGRLVRHPDLKAWVFGTGKNGACTLRSKRGCELHAVHGAEAKPDGCKRFPYGLVATPDGGRITTEHRCPCRSMGERPPLTESDAQASLADRAGRLVPNGKVLTRVRLSPGKSVSFARYKELETALVEGLLVGQAPTELLGVKPFGRLDGEKFTAIADEILAEGKDDASGYGCALTWFGRAIHACLDGRPLPLGDRPWSRYFDIAERRPGQRSAEAVLADYLADLVWSMDWYFSIGSFKGARRELATLHAIAARITKRLVRAGARADRAAAEAVMVVELARQSGAWERVQESL
jgi:hypothetical protein